jgi:hypothetical protein
MKVAKVTADVKNGSSRSGLRRDAIGAAARQADWGVKHLPVDHDLVSGLRFSGLDPVRRF